MVNLLLAASAALLLPLAPPGETRKSASKANTGTLRVAQVRIQQHFVIRVPRSEAIRRVSAPAAPLPPIAWVEKDAEKCVKMQSLAGATITRPDSVDLFLAGGKRLRAKLGNECPALDFYDGFYLNPEDERVCAKRDVIRSRMGGGCRIERFRELVPKRGG